MSRFKKTKEEAENIKVALGLNDEGKYTYNVSIHNVQSNITTTINGTTLKYITEIMKSLDKGIKKNVREGSEVKGSHKNNRTTDSKTTKL